MTRPKISLAALLVFCALSAFGFLWVSRVRKKAERQRLAVHWLSEQWHGAVRYSWQPQSGGFVDPQATNVGFVGRLIGAEYVQAMEEVSVSDPKLSDLSAVEGQVNLKILEVSSGAPLDLRALATLSQLQYLSLHAAELTTLEPLLHLEDLRYVSIFETEIPSKEVVGFRKARPEVQLVVVD